MRVELRWRWAVSSLLLVVVAFMLTKVIPEANWFVLGACLLCIVAACVAVPRVRCRLWPGHPAKAFTCLAVLTLLFVVQSYETQLHRQRTDRLDLVGVEYPFNSSRVYMLGVGEGVDVRFAAAPDEFVHWRVGITPEAEGFRITSSDGVDAISQQRAPATLPETAQQILGFWRWPQVYGARLDADSPEIWVRHNPSDPWSKISLSFAGDLPRLDWNGSQAPLALSDTSDSGWQVQRVRLARQLRGGLKMGELAWNGSIPSSAEDLVLTMTSEPRQRLRRFSDHWGILPRYSFRLASRHSEWAVTNDTASGQQALPLLAARDTVAVWAGGQQWRFVLFRELGSGIGYDAGKLIIGFGSRPGPSLGWLPSNTVCPVASQCTLVSSRPLPPSVPHFDLSGFGLDTARYSFLGRISVSNDSVTLVTPWGTLSSRAGRPLIAGARENGRQLPAELRFQVFRPAGSGSATVRWTLLALTLFVVACALLVSNAPSAWRLIGQESLASRAAIGVASVATVLLGLRLALGYRVAHAFPYHDRAAETACALVLVLAALSAALLRWTDWGPAATRTLRRIEAFFSLRTTQRFYSAQGPVVQQPSSATPDHAKNAGSSDRAGARTVVATAMACVSMWILLGQFGRQFGFRIIVSVGTVLLVWVLVAFLAARAPGAEEPRSAGSLLHAEDGPLRAGLVIAYVVLGPLLALSVLARDFALPIATLLAMMLFIAKLALMALDRLRWDEGSVNHSHESRDPLKRYGAGAVAVLTLILFQIVLAISDGPTVLFVAVFFFFLLAIRVGNRVGRGLAGGDLRSGVIALAMMFGALLVVVKIDFGLMLVLGLPFLLTLLLAIRPGRLPRPWLATLLVLLIVAGGLTWPILRPTLDQALEGKTPAETSVAFENLGGMLGRAPGVRGPARQSIVRSLAASQPHRLERALARVGPSLAREEIIPAIEQIWGGRAYIASGSLLGDGLASPLVLGRGVPIAVADAENTFAVFVVAEHGFLGGLVVLCLYAAFVLIGIRFLIGLITEPSHVTRPNTTAVAVTVGGILMLVFPALYVAASNLGRVPLTGQNMPLLGLNAWSDVAFSAAILSSIVATLLDSDLLEDL